MGSRGLEIVRFRGRYYIRWHQYDSYFEGLGARIVASIPAEPKNYQAWLDSMRAEYAARELALERHAYEIRDGCKPDYTHFDEFVTLPSELPRLNGYHAENIYILNLDQEVLTMNYGIHWKLGNIPRRNELWLRAIEDSIYPYKPTISLAVCPEEHVASPALELPELDPYIEYAFRTATPKTNIEEARKAFFTRVLAEVVLEYRDEIIRFGMEWSPVSSPFRELAFALVSIASGQASFLSFPAQKCDPRNCTFWDCESNHLPKSHGWFDDRWAGEMAPLLEFGSACHRPGDPPGASPTETMYWHEDVLVSLALIVDGAAISSAVTWGIDQGRTNFHILVMSLFEISFAEVFFTDDGPLVYVSVPLDLSPLRRNYCMSTHPRQRPELKPGMKIQHHVGELVMRSNCTGTARRLRNHFPGLAALVNFYDTAASRRLIFNAGCIPLELCDRILDFVDYDTWKTCLAVSPQFRTTCLRKYRLDEQMRIVAGPFRKLHRHRKQTVLSFDFENMQTGKIISMMQLPYRSETKESNWMPVLGCDRKVLMSDVVIQFDLAEDVPAEGSSDDETRI